MANHRAHVLVLASIFAALAAAAAEAQQPREYSINPSSGAVGKTFGVVVQSDNTCGTQNHLEGMEILASGDITVNDQAVQSGCLLTGTFTISESAKLGERLLPIVRQQGNTDDGEVGVVRFEITPVEARPLPPGLDAQVDLMWKILARKAVHDNFGRRIAGRYYAVEAMIGNNSGFDLQIAGVGFSMPACMMKEQLVDSGKYVFDCESTKDEKSSRKLPSDSYQIVRGSLEREDEFGRRHFALGAIKALGLLMTGLVPFLDTPGSDAPKVANFINSPVQAGFEVLFPRTTLRQLQRLEIQALHDGMIIPHNAQRRALAFIAKDVVGLEKPDRDHPQKVMARLGEMILVGRQVDYLNRVQIVSQGSGAVRPPLVTTTLLEEIAQGESDQPRRVVGLNLEGAIVVAQNETFGLTVGDDIVADATGLFVNFTVSASPDAQLGRQTLLVRNTDGVFPVNIDVVPAVPAPTEQEFTMEAANSEADLAIAGANLRDIQSIQAIDGTGQAVTTITFTKQPGGTDTSSTWRATADPSLDRSAERTYTLHLTYSSQGLTLTETSLTLKVEAVPAP